MKSERISELWSPERTEIIQMKLNDAEKSSKFLI